MADEKVRDEMPERVWVGRPFNRGSLDVYDHHGDTGAAKSCCEPYVRADLLARAEAERDAEKQRAERWKALATSAECAGCGQPNKGEADWWAGCGDDWHERQREALAAESAATERKT